MSLSSGPALPRGCAPPVRQRPACADAGTCVSARRLRAPCACRCRCCRRRCRGRSGWTWRAGLPRGRPPPDRPRPGAPRPLTTACARARSCGGRCGRRSGAPAERHMLSQLPGRSTSCTHTQQRCMRTCRAKARSQTAWIMLAPVWDNGVRGRLEAQHGEREVSSCALDVSQGGRCRASKDAHVHFARTQIELTSSHANLSGPTPPSMDSRPAKHEVHAAAHTCAAARKHASPTAGCTAGCRPHPCAADEVA
jgi:hypothetical protein